MALESTQPLTEMSTRNISWGVKVAGAWGWQPYHLHVPIVFKSGILNLLEPSGSVQACNGIALLFALYHDARNHEYGEYQMLPDMFTICSAPLCKMEGEILNTATLLAFFWEFWNIYLYPSS